MSKAQARIYVSPPHLDQSEFQQVQKAMESNWIAPIGPHLNQFEAELSARLEHLPVLAVNTGTAALHLALHMANVLPGDEVLCPTFTFCATANAIRYVGAKPVFVDCDLNSWNMELDLMLKVVEDKSRKGKRIKTAMVVDNYGMPTNISALRQALGEDVTVVEDAAEALGSTLNGKPAGTAADYGILSFNGNKVLTTSGGGCLICPDQQTYKRAFKLATHGMEKRPYYYLDELGYNYRLSNILAAIGLGQLQTLDDRLARRRMVYERYHAAFSNVPGVGFQVESPEVQSNRWLTAIVFDRKRYPGMPEKVMAALEEENIESRRVWKPLHTQPLYQDCEYHGRGVADELFECALCLPSGSSLSHSDQDRIIGIVEQTLLH